MSRDTILLLLLDPTWMAAVGVGGSLPPPPPLVSHCMVGFPASVPETLFREDIGCGEVLDDAPGELRPSSWNIVCSTVGPCADTLLSRLAKSLNGSSKCPDGAVFKG